MSVLVCESELIYFSVTLSIEWEVTIRVTMYGVSLRFIQFSPSWLVVDRVREKSFAAARSAVTNERKFVLSWPVSWMCVDARGHPAWQ